MAKTSKTSNRFRGDVEKGLFRTPLTITNRMEKWFHKLSTSMKESGGYKMPKTYILRALINAAMKLDINVDGVKKEEELQERILEAIRRYK